MDGMRWYSSGAYSLAAIAILLLVVILLVPLLVLGVAGAAFSRLGFSWIEAVAVLVLMLIGNLVNIPLRTFRVPPPPGSPGANVFDAFTGEPVDDGRSSGRVSLNLGGAIIPAGVSLFLLHEAGRISAGSVAVPLAVCIALVALVTYHGTTVLPGWGIRAPLFLPGIVSLACALLLAGGSGLAAGVVAYTGGTMGVLIGATAAGLTRGVAQGIRQVSIGGSGMFGTVLLCALLPALVA